MNEANIFDLDQLPDEKYEVGPNSGSGEESGLSAVEEPRTLKPVRASSNYDAVNKTLLNELINRER